MPTPWLLLSACAKDVDPGGSPEPVDTGGSELHDVLIAPYVQSVEPDGAWILWETATGAHSVVELGLTEALGVTVAGTSSDEMGAGVLHEVHLSQLMPDTRYYYRVRTSGTYSDILSFRTAPAPGPGASFRFVAMSDMQTDEGRPAQWSTTVSEGVIAYATEVYDEELSDALAFALLPGDLVNSGWALEQWQDEFFPGATPLMGRVPLYPVYGNHEGGTPFFTWYFHLPDDGTPGYEEHWYTLRWANLLVVGLDSNLAVTEQLDWLGGVLGEACSDDDLQFVVAQLHHPFKSELWLPGELDYTGDVIERLEDFSTACGKPSIHLFGHTHGYSRGQSRDHTHLWVNVATAGGAIDTWGSTEQADYEQFNVSLAEYGFVVVEVDDGQLSLQRISLGTPEAPLDNEVVDEVTVLLDPVAPDRPTLVADGEGLVASAFSGDGQLGASHFQVSADCADFDAPIVDSWRQFEDRYMGQDLMAGVDLGRLDVSGLGPGSWCARVRYRDRGLAWSEWSDAVALTMSE